MTKTKLFSLLTVGVIGASCFNLTAFADTAYEIGDVDMDGVITGHDTALVSRHLVKGDITLTEEQLILADVDGDGEVTQADADKLYNELQTITLGFVMYAENKFICLDDAGQLLRYYVRSGAGLEHGLTTQQLNLADMDADGEVTLNDVNLILKYYVICGAGMSECISANGVYYYSVYSDDPGFLTAAGTDAPLYDNETDRPIVIDPETGAPMIDPETGEIVLG